MIVIIFIFLGCIPMIVIVAIAGIILNIIRAARGPLPKRAYWDPNHPRYREAHTVYIAAEPQN